MELKMCNNLVKLFIFTWLIVNADGSEKAANGGQRLRTRQVVQPKWLSQNGNLNLFPVDKSVKVTAQNLQETADIREAIQAAVNEGRYAMPAEASTVTTPLTTTPTPTPTPIRSPFTLAHFQRMWLEFLENSRRLFAPPAATA